MHSFDAITGINFPFSYRRGEEERRGREGERESVCVCVFLREW
jgi:hypothetical protein